MHTHYPQKRTPKPNRPSARPKPIPLKIKPAQPPAPQLLRTRFSSAQLLEHFAKLLPKARLASWLAPSQREFYTRAFTPLVTLWYLIFQRLGDHHHLSHVVEDALAGGADRLSPRAKPLSRQLRSEATTSFSDARQRLPLELCRNMLWHTAAQIAASVQIPKWFGLRVGLIDGTTCRFRPYGDIPQHFPAHRPGTCKSQPYWCVARVVGLFCLATGAVLDSAMGSLKASEQALSALLLKRSWHNWLLVADRNFGVYSVAAAARAAQAHLLVRLTQVRAAKLARLAGIKLAPELDVQLQWCASRHDQCPEGLTTVPVPGRLLVVRLDRPGFRPFTLCLFTTLLDKKRCTAQALAQLYGQRWQVELCFRYVKTQLDLGFLECRSADMARKEWLAGLIAYYLIRCVMAAAAAIAQVPLPQLSFSRARELLLGWLCRTAARRTLGSWDLLLRRIAKARLPKRRARRLCEPRSVRRLQHHFPNLVGSRAPAREKLKNAWAKS
jgi:hypothetical protein